MKVISVDQHIVRRRMVDVLNEIFGYDDKAVPRGYKLPENDQYIIWFVKLSVDEHGRDRIPWIDLLSADGKKLVVSWGGDDFDRDDAEAGALKYINRRHVVFVNRLGDIGYEFVGVFECQKGSDGSWYQSDGKRHYKCISHSVDVDEVRLDRRADGEVPREQTQRNSGCVCVRKEKIAYKPFWPAFASQIPYLVILILGLALFSGLFKVPRHWYSSSVSSHVTEIWVRTNRFGEVGCVLEGAGFVNRRTMESEGVPNGKGN